MENYFDNYKLGDCFYDPVNDRYIVIDSISIGLRTVHCYIEEYDGELEKYVVTGRSHFTMRELNKYFRGRYKT